MSPDDRDLLMAKLKALNTIANLNREEAITGFVEEIQKIPSCAEQLKEMKVIKEQALFDDETAVAFINSF